ncbi:hypothetical protein SELMODRAFT_405943 [Selaginella moellendorffii]|uniref:Uncharacterized protein n=1 Tax=Selaginella moellendorffii TaxID=88036 RepID=D8R059_SELML|nr:hypothetical protein SELMODRAFT_405943 [Selaginella moellendorffii]
MEVIKRHPPEMQQVFNFTNIYHGMSPALAHYDCLADPAPEGAARAEDSMPFEPGVGDAPGGVPDSINSLLVQGSGNEALQHQDLLHGSCVQKDRLNVSDKLNSI